jgi:membrane-bound lytic murein transglycosylase MltF
MSSITPCNTNVWVNVWQKASIGLLLLATPLLTGTASTRSYVDGHMSVGDIQAYLQSRMANRSSHEVRSLAKLISKLCRENDFTPATVLSLVDAESRFNPSVVSSAGAIGLMQLKPETAHFIARRNSLYYRAASDLKNPGINLTIGVHYLAYLRDQFDSSEAYLSAYNMGPSKFRRFQLVAHRPANGNDATPTMVRRYVQNIQNGVLGIKRDASRLRQNQKVGTTI